jgi:hypothetical protein
MNGLENVEQYFSLAAARRNLEKLLTALGVLGKVQNSSTPQPKIIA